MEELCFSMEVNDLIKKELVLIEKLKEEVNSKEEYEMLVQREKELKE